MEFEPLERYASRRHSMSQPQTGSSVTRRTAIAGAGAGAIGLALARFRLAAAQDATPAAMTDHPVVGAWRWVDYPNSPNPDIVLSILVPDGTYVDHSPGRSVGVGEWRSTGERSAELISVSNVLVPLDALFGDGHVVIPEELFERGERVLWRFTMEIDETGNHFTSTGSAETQDSSGNIISTVPYDGYGDRMTVAGE
jgi:hypothetical protein